MYLCKIKCKSMGYLGDQDRFQIQMSSMEEFIDKENTVRFVDAFVEQLELDKLGFEIATLKTEGRPAFNPKVYLKLDIFLRPCASYRYSRMIYWKRMLKHLLEALWIFAKQFQPKAIRSYPRSVAIKSFTARN